MKIRKTLLWGLLAVFGCTTPEDRGVEKKKNPSGQPGDLHPDLEATLWLTEIALANGQELDVSVTVKNRGAAASEKVSGRWELLGPGLEAVFDASIPALDPRQSAKVSFTYPFAPTQVGEFVLSFTADPDGELEESDLDNNSDSLSISVAAPDIPPPLANLEVTLEEGPLTFDVDSGIVAEATITNYGPESVPVAGVWELQRAGFYSSMPVTVPALGVDESIKVIYLHPPGLARSGHYSLTFTAYPDGSAVESDPTDNAAEIAVLLVPFPNLAVEILSAMPMMAESATAVTLQVRWSNTGLSPLLFSKSASQAAEVHLVAGDESLNWTTYIRSVTVPVLAPGESTTSTYLVEALRGPGSYAWQITVQTTPYEVAVTDDTDQLAGVTITSPLQLMWSSTVPSPSISLPATMAVNADGTWDLLIGSLSSESGTPDLYAVDGQNGMSLWSLELSGTLLAFLNAPEAAAFAYAPDIGALTAIDASVGTWLWEYPISSTYTSYRVTDLDRDGNADLLVAGNESLALLSVTDATVQWQWPFDETPNSFSSAPFIYEFTHDSYPDFALASLEGKVYVFANTDSTGPALAWEKQLDAPIVGGPVVSDLNGDGDLDMTVAELNGGLYAYSASTGTSMWAVTLPVNRIWMAPAVVKRNGEPGVDLVISGASPSSGDLGRWTSTLSALDGATGASLWSVERPGTPGPVVAIDIDHDGSDEILWLLGDRSPEVLPLNLPALTGAKGWMYLISNGGLILSVFEIPGVVWSPPLAGDLDADEWLDIVLVGAGPDGALMRLATPWSWPEGSGWVGAAGANVHSGF